MVYDVLVIGAGPAGSWAAHECAKAGLDTLILEKHKLPRDKPCGGLVGKNAVRKIGAHKLIDRKTTGYRVFMQEEEITETKSEGYFFERKKLDQFITKKARKAGACVRDREKVEKFSLETHCAKITTEKDEYYGKIVIAANGVNSHIARQGGIKPLSPDELCLASEIEAKMKNKRIDELLGNEKKEYFNTYLYPGFAGYGWIFPKNNKINVGIGGMLEQAGEMGERFERLLQETGLEELRKREKKAHLIPLNTTEKAYSERLLLVGDAGGFTDPITGGGIDMAIGTGEKAAKACIEAVERDDFRILRKYQGMCAPEIRFIKKQRFFLKILARLARSRMANPASARITLRLVSRLIF